MKQRNPLAVVFLPFVTFGIYSLVWQVKTKNEMKALGADIPTAWLLIVPFVNLWWLWKYSEGVEKVTAGKTSQVLAFVLQFLLGSIGGAILQNEFNKVGSGAPSVDYPAAAPVDTIPAGPNPYAEATIEPTSTPPTNVVPPTLPQV